MWISGKKVIFGILIGIFAVVVAFCIMALIFASINKISFIEQIKQWFGIAKQVAEQTDETANIFGYLK